MTRSQRNERVHARTRALTPVMVAGAALVTVVMIGLVVVMSLGSADRSDVVTPGSASSQSGLFSTDGTSSTDASGASGAGVAIEVPDVVGKSVQIAEALISGAGLIVQTRVSDAADSLSAANSVTEQSPGAGARVQAGTVVTLVYKPPMGAGTDGRRYIVMIDAGHQAEANLGLEPIGPGSKVRKAKVSPGATGVGTGAQESAATLAVSLLLRDALEAAGVDVRMVRTADDVDIPNSERAKLGSRAEADLVVRVHQSFSSDGTVAGVTTFYPSGNSWVGSIEASSSRAATLVEDALTKATEGRRLGVVGRGDLSGFNYSTVPSIMAEYGYLSNRAEDAKMATPAYQASIANGISTGVIAYLKTLQ